MKTFSTGHGEIRYRDEGSGVAVVFVHGTPSHSEEFVPCLEELRRQNASVRFLALDHLGFGASDKPADFDYSLQNHAAHFSRWIDSLNLSELHLVAHDFGGPISLPWAIRNPQKIKSLTLLNTWFWPLEFADHSFESQKGILGSRLMKFLYLWINISPKYLVKFAWGTRKPFSEQIREQFTKPFRRKKDRKALYGCVEALLEKGEKFWQTHSIDGLMQLQLIPTQFIWGMKDPLIKPAHLAEWRVRLPAAKVTEVADAGHFVAMEAPEIVAKAIAEKI